MATSKSPDVIAISCLFRVSVESPATGAPSRTPAADPGYLPQVFVFVVRSTVQVRVTPFWVMVTCAVPVPS